MRYIIAALIGLALTACAIPPATPDANFNACLAMGGAPSYVMAGRDVVKFECVR
jgi:hypothetical protein